MAATIKIKNSSTTGSVPSASNLVQGELAVNVTDLGLYTENASGTVVKLNAPSIDDKNTGATKHLTIDTSGNLGLGVTPSAWGSNFLALQAGSGSALWAQKNAPATFVSSNTYYDGTNFKYISTNQASYYQQANAAHLWFNAASGTAGTNITFTQAMTLDASGNFLVGTTTAREQLTVNSAGYFAGDFNNANAANGLYVSGNSSGVSQIRGYNTSGGVLAFFTNPAAGSGAERARIDSSGNLLVGTTSNVLSSRLTVAKNNSSTLAFFSQDYSAGNADNVAFVNGYATGSNAAVQCRFYNNSLSSVGTITSSGSATAYNTSSDYRLKNTIAPMTGALAKVAQLKPVTYKWNADGSDGEGFIAHELAEICPQAVAGEKDAVDEDGNPVYQGIDVSFLVATLTAAIQELNAKFEAYKATHP